MNTSRFLLAAATVAICTLNAAAEPANPPIPTLHKTAVTPKVQQPAKSHKNLRGWDHLFKQLVKYGVDADEFAAIFSDSRMPSFDGLTFSVRPREAQSLYRGHQVAERNTRAIKFFEENAEYFEQAYQRFGVDPAVILAIIQVESNAGAFTGKSRVIYGLARLAAASDPQNIERVYQQARRKDQTITRQQVADRAQYLEDTFLPHVAGTVQLSKHIGIDPLELKGSHSGAIGLCQFLPGNVISYGIDADDDGFVNVFQAPDAILSTANFLASYGWSDKTTSVSEKRAIIWNYNRSEPYIDTVLSIASSHRARVLAMLRGGSRTNDRG